MVKEIDKKPDMILTVDHDGEAITQTNKQTNKTRSVIFSRDFNIPMFICRAKHKKNKIVSSKYM